MEVINENKLGVAKGTAVEEEVRQEFRGETMEVGLYLAMARQAQREGLPEVAEVLKSIAMDEAWHAARFAELNGMISEDTKANIEKMLKGEIEANNGKKQAATKAKEAGIDEAHDAFDESSRDEARHARALEGLLKRYFNK
ncbi:MAG TPA: rubrerythrin family protein [Syntrophomonadaceae bacterium]|nr:rubrerythrin family protein [Syntrophomonadaceae bacterium]